MSYLKITLLALAGLLVVFAVVRMSGEGAVLSLLGEETHIDIPVSENSKLIGTRAPYFDLPDVSGNHVRSSEYTGAPLVIVFWATWDQNAADQMKILDDYLALDDIKIQVSLEVIAISSQEERSIVASYMRRGGYRVKTLVDAQGIVSHEYDITSLPVFYFVDADGIVRDVHRGLLSTAMIVEKVEGILQ